MVLRIATKSAALHSYGLDAHCHSVPRDPSTGWPGAYGVVRLVRGGWGRGFVRMDGRMECALAGRGRPVAKAGDEFSIVWREPPLTGGIVPPGKQAEAAELRTTPGSARPTDAGGDDHAGEADDGPVEYRSTTYKNGSTAAGKFQGDRLLLGVVTGPMAGGGAQAGVCLLWDARKQKHLELKGKATKRARAAAKRAWSSSG